MKSLTFQLQYRIRLKGNDLFHLLKLNKKLLIVTMATKNLMIDKFLHSESTRLFNKYHTSHDHNVIQALLFEK